MTDTSSVATCSANRYSIDNFGTPSITCDEFVYKNCENNEDLPVFASQSLNLKKLPISGGTSLAEQPSAHSENEGEQMSTQNAKLFVMTVVATLLISALLLG